MQFVGDVSVFLTLAQERAYLGESQVVVLVITNIVNNCWYFCSLGPHLEKTNKMITYDDQTSQGVSTTPVLRVCTCHVIKK